MLTLMDEPENLPVAGRVVWITPEGAQSNRQAGIGIEFSDEDGTINARIENYLGLPDFGTGDPHALIYRNTAQKKRAPRGP